MKKIIIMLICIFVITGCNSKNDLSGGWINESNVKYENVDKLDLFNKSMKSSKYDLEPITLLGTQVVSGTNYMYLAREKKNKEWKIVVIYENLKNKTKVLSVTDFNINDYVNKDIKVDKKELTGGFTVNENVKENNIDKKINNLLKNDYKSIAYLARQIVNGTNHAVLVYSKKEKCFLVLTIYEDLKGNFEIKNKAFVNLVNLNN